LTYRKLLSENADFRRLWIGQVVSEIGDWLNNVAVLALVIQLAGSERVARAIAIYALVRHVPLLLFGPVAGVVVDRYDRRRVMIVADVARAAIALCFLLATRLGALPVIYTVGASLFAVSSFFNAAKRASIPNVTRGPQQLLSANSLSASTTAATIAIGSALGGIIAAFVSRESVFVINAATFLISAEMIRRLKTETRNLKQDDKQVEVEQSEASPTRLRLFVSSLARASSEFRAGLRYVRQHDVLGAIFVVAAGWGLGNGVARALYSIFGARLGVEAAAGMVARPTDFGISVLFVAMGVGGLLGAPIARRFNAGSGASLGARMGRSMVFDGCGLVVFSFMPNLWGASAVLIAREINFAIWWTAQQTIMMSRTDDRYGGRVFASYETLTTLMMVGSMTAAGLAADIYGIRPVAAAGGAVITFSGLLWFVLRRRTRRTINQQMPKGAG
jgi:MFS family permease